ncbi:MAG: hypothetical protein IPJ82_23055 [Lewinellaceae bacterium]|nr:hypothetical protein [Lewinellaceae bacterium]
MLNELPSVSSGLANEPKFLYKTAGMCSFSAQTADLTSYNAFFAVIWSRQPGRSKPALRQASQVNTEELRDEGCVLNKSAPTCACPLPRATSKSPFLWEYILTSLRRFGPCWPNSRKVRGFI